MTMDEELFTLAQQVGKLLTERNLKLTTVESCTGGGLAYWITEVPGASNWFDRGFITYQDIAKQQMVGVSEEVLAKHGAVSETTAVMMAKGALKHSQAQVSMAITGIAGPSGGSPGKPVGLVWIAWATATDYHTQQLQLRGDRTTIRTQTIATALNALIRRLEKMNG